MYTNTTKIKDLTENGPLDISHLLMEHAKCSASPQKSSEDIGEYVSQHLATEYPVISPKIYDLTREVTLVPSNSTEIVNQFFSDTFAYFNDRGESKDQRGDYQHTPPTICNTIPLILLARYEDEREIKIGLGELHPKINYEIKKIAIYDRYKDDRKTLLETEAYCNTKLTLVNHSGIHSVTLTGTWTYGGKVESCTVKVPAVPETAIDRAAEAQARYFSLLADAKREGKFKGKTLPQPELYIAWIPTEDQFSLKVKEVPRPVSKDPALLLRIDKKHDHVIALWDDEKEISLDAIVKKYSSK